MTVVEVIQKGADHLAKKGVDSPRLQIELMLAHVLGMPRLNLYLNFDRVLQNSELDVVRDWVKRRGQREPLQYLLGCTSFCGIDLQVGPGVLIPRPETEVLAEHAWTWLREGRIQDMPEIHVLDFGTGSGCLAVALALHCETARLWAVDKSAPALEVAEANARKHQVHDRICFLQGDDLGVVSNQRFHLIVSNPPYIPSREIARLQPEVRDHEPHLALDGGEDGLVVLRQLALSAKDRLAPGGRFMAEFGDGQELLLPALFPAPPWRQIQFQPDNSGRPRILIAESEGLT